MVGGIKRRCASDVWRLSVVYVGPKSGTERPRKKKNWHRGSPRHTWLGHHFQGQKVKGQLAGGGAILWRPPEQLVIQFFYVNFTTKCCQTLIQLSANLYALGFCLRRAFCHTEPITKQCSLAAGWIRTHALCALHRIYELFKCCDISLVWSFRVLRRVIR